MVDAPPGRLAQPGDYVTFVFLVRGGSAGTYALDARSSHGWAVLGPAPTVDLAAGVSAPVAVTVAVPASARAGDPDAVTLTVVGNGQQAEGATTIDVAARLDLRLDVPQTVAVGGDLSVTVTNSGNVPATATVSVGAAGEEVGTREVRLEPGASATVTFPVERAERYEVRLLRDGTVLALRTVDTIVHGLPAPSTYALGGSVTASLASDLAWSAGAELRGPLSDRANLDVRLSADAPTQSHAELRTPRFGVRLGEQGADPFGLPSVAGFGVSVLVAPDPFALLATGTWVEDDRFTGRLAIDAVRDLENVEFAAAVGLREGAPSVAVRAAGTIDGGTASVSTSFDGERLAAEYLMRARDATGSYQVRLAASDVLTEFGRFDASASWLSGRTSLYALGTAALGSEAADRLQVGGTAPLVSLAGGGVSASFGVGIPESYGTLAFAGDPRSGVRPSASAGVLYRPADLGWGVSGQAGLALGGGTRSATGWSSSAEARLQYFPGADAVRGRVGGRVLGQMPPLTLFGSGGWDVGSGSVAFGLGGILDSSPVTLQLDASGRFDPSAARPWGASVRLQGRVDVAVPVPESVVQAAGGRRHGTVRVRVVADGEPMAGIGIAVGRYRVATGPDGDVTLELPPGAVTVAVDLAQLAANLQLTGAGTRTVVLEDGAGEEVTFELQRTAAVRGTVLADADADGTADVPPRGVAARVVVYDALGQAHGALTTSDGAFVVRGLPAGATRVAVEGLEVGSSVVGDAVVDLVLEAGDRATVDFVVQPVTARAQVFGASALRIRDIAPEVRAAPPASAPLVNVTVVGDPDAVELVANGVAVAARAVGADRFVARVPIPKDAVGVVTFEVRASKGDTSTTRSGTILVREDAAAVEVASLGVAAPGSTLGVEVHTLFAAASVTAGYEDDEPTALRERSPGRWAGDLTLPAAAPPGLHEVRIVAVGRDGTVYEQTTRVRIGAP